MSINGNLPASDLATTYLYGPGTTTGRRLLKAAAPSAEAMALAFYLRFDKPLYATDGYRDLDTQWTLYRRYLSGYGAPAAYPGTSNHGWGKALDLASNINSFSSTEHKWMTDHAGKFGWVHPYWARQGGGRDEAWHWEWVGGGDTEPRIHRPEAGQTGLGDSGDRVRTIQTLLNKNLQPENHVSVDGGFGLGTAVAVMKFQSSRGLAPVGAVGAVTMDRLRGEATDDSSPDIVIYLKEGTSNAEGTIKLQRFLKNNFEALSDLHVDGDFGPATTKAVKFWQSKAGFTPTGQIGPQSRARLVELGVFEPLKD